MQYFGGKARIAKYIVPYLEGVRKQNQQFLEPFVGGANIVSKMSGERIACDFNEYLIEMYRNVQHGYELPDELSEEQYKDIKNNKDKDKCLTGFAGFGCSFAGKWFGGYARNNSNRNYCKASINLLLKKMSTMQNVIFEWKDYKTLQPKGMLIYCDPPYKDTTKYTGVPDFDSEQFWDVMREWSKENDVYISEYQAPADFISVLDMPTKTSIRDSAGNVIEMVEKLFTYKKEKEEKTMELKMNEYQLPAQILFNYEELKQELIEKVSHYETIVYTDDQIQEAKKDKANLNKLKKALNDERIRREREYMVPFNDFKAKINEIISIIDKPVAVIDKQVKAYEDKLKQDKLDAIMEYFYQIPLTIKPNWLTFEQINDEKWLNASVSMKSVQADIDSKLEQIANDTVTLSNLPEFGFEAQEVYKSTLDMNRAIYEAQKMSQIAKAKAEREAEQARLKAEAETKAAEEVVPFEEVPVATPAKQWVSFKALLSTEDALALKDFFNSRNIEFKPI